MLILVAHGFCHKIYIPDQYIESFKKWCEGISRPRIDVLKAVIQHVADLPFTDLQRLQRLWVIEHKGNPVIYAIK